MTLYLLSTFKKLVSNICSPAQNQHITITSSVPVRKLQLRNDAYFDVSFREGAFNWNCCMRTTYHLDTDCQGPAARTLASYTGSPGFNLGPETLSWGPSYYSSVLPCKSLEAISRQPTRTSFHITSNPAFINHPTTHSYAVWATGSVVKLTITKIKIDLLLSWRQEIFWISCRPVSLDPKSVVEIFPREVDSIVSSADEAIFFTYNDRAKLTPLTQ
jgi:hypothetical protein